MPRPHHLASWQHRTVTNTLHLLPQMFGHLQGPVIIPPPALSPRVGTFLPMHYPFNSPNVQQHLSTGPQARRSRSKADCATSMPAHSHSIPNSLAACPCPLHTDPLGGNLANIACNAVPIGPPKPKIPLVPPRRRCWRLARAAVARCRS